MQTISINFIIPGSWKEMSDKQLRYVYQLLADNFGTDEVKTLFLLKWSGTKVIGRQDSGSYLVKLGKQMFELTYHSRRTACQSRLARRYADLARASVKDEPPSGSRRRLSGCAL